MKNPDALHEGVSELRVHARPGYRIYFTRCGDVARAVGIIKVAKQFGLSGESLYKAFT